MTQLSLRGQAVKEHSHDVKLGRGMKGHASADWIKLMGSGRPAQQNHSYRSGLESSKSFLCSLEVMSVTVNTSFFFLIHL